MSDSVFKRIGDTFAIGVGSLRIELDEKVYTLGQRVRGSVILDLKEPTPAKRLVVVVEATRKHRRSVSDGRGGTTMQTETESLYRFEQVLDHETEYTSGSHSFLLPLPKAEPTFEPPSGALGDAVRVIAAVQRIASAVSPKTAFVEWRVRAALERPWKVDLKADADIAVG